MKGTAERGCRAPGEPCGGSFHSPVGWLTLIGQLEESLPRETINGKNRAWGTHSHTYTQVKTVHANTSTSLPSPQNNFLFNLPHNNRATVYWPLPMMLFTRQSLLWLEAQKYSSDCLARCCKSTIIQLAFLHSKLRIQIRMCDERLGEGVPPWQPRWLDHQRRQLDVITIISAVTNQLKGIPALKACIHMSASQVYAYTHCM